MSECGCGGGTKRKVLLYGCSGGANVAEASDLACRQLMAEGLGSMFCLAGLGAGIPNMVQQARDADLNVVIDGCPTDCGRKIFENLGINNVAFVRVTELGFEKKPKGTRAQPQEVQAIVERVRQLASRC
jgi:uncharacterized metal-binding protein